jgi:microcystin-dependent protein
MGLETVTYISDLNTANPPASDGLVQGDDHIRNIKSALKTTFPNITGAVTATHSAINTAAAAFDSTGHLLAAAGAVATPGQTFTGDTDTGWSNPSANTLKGSVGGAEFMGVTSAKAVTFASSVTADTLVGTNGVSGPGTIPVGGTILWWTDTLPTNYLWCNHAAVSRTTYAALFALIGTTYGAGDGSTTFNLPDLRDVAPVGKGTMGGASAAGRITNYVTTALGTVIGACLHLLTTGEMPSHTHTATSTVTDPGHTHDGITGGVQSGSGATRMSAFTGTTNATGVVASATTGVTVATSNANTGGGTSHDNVSPGTICNFIIRAL